MALPATWPSTLKLSPRSVADSFRLVVREWTDHLGSLGLTQSSSEASHRVKCDVFVSGQFPESVDDPGVLRDSCYALNNHLTTRAVGLVQGKLKKNVRVFRRCHCVQRVTDCPLQCRLLGYGGVSKLPDQRVCSDRAGV